VRELQQAGHTVHEVRHRYDVDLRAPGALDRFNNASIDFAFFLAYEAGTPKDWDIPGNGKRIVTGNTRMYDAVLPYLAGRRIPYLFPSSGYAALNATAFHRLKLDGEARVLAANSSGKVVKLWDVYGYRKGAMHSQELAEWMHQCASGEAVIRATCSSDSRTQLAHVDDIARALVDVMVSFDRLAPVTDVSTGVWLSNRQVAAALARASGGACHVHFHRKQDVKREMNPANLWRVHHDFRMRDVLQSFVADVARHRSWQTRDDIYLSIIVASSNDDYNGIRRRMFAFVHHLAAAAARVYLDYELVVVQYNPRVPSNGLEHASNASAAAEYLPLPALIPLTLESAQARLRFVTVPADLHQHANKGKLWEYVAKNAGIRRARGRFVLLTNPDDLFPLELLGWLAKEQLQADVALVAHLILNFAPSDATGMQAACDAASASLAFSSVQPEVRKSCRSAIAEEHKRNVGAYARSGWASGGTLYDVRTCFTGDFSIWSRQAFLDSGGYVETYQNLHVETAHKAFVQQWAASPIKKWHYVDQPTCHQAHSRRGRPKASLTLDELTRMYKNRTDGAKWGFHQKSLPVGTAASALERGYNPLTPFALYRHHRIFEEFVVHQADFDAEHLIDFVGTKSRYENACADWDSHQHRQSLGARVLCARHAAFKAMDVGSFGLSLLGDLPVIDGEYAEWISLLQAVRSFAESATRSAFRPFVIAEFGTRYGAWAARGARSVQSLVPGAHTHVCLVESNATSYARAVAHLERNVRPSLDHFLFQGGISNGSAPAPGIQYGADHRKQNAMTVTIADVLAQYDTIDIAHISSQAAETMCTAEAVIVLSTKLKSMHVRTHTADIHAHLRARFKVAGWSVEHDFLPGSADYPPRIHSSNFGPVNGYANGELRIINLALVGV
jgi:nucleoside-diphosphate-sugar epimerase